VNQNAKKCCNWIHTRAGEVAAKRETTMSAREGPSAGGVNPMPKTSVLDWILLGFDEGQSSGKEERVGEGASKWAKHPPHICEHKYLATTKRGLGNNHNNDETSFSESHCLFTYSIDGA
jgi:hypothetical protein